LRREKGFGATLCVATDPAWRPWPSASGRSGHGPCDRARRRGRDRGGFPALGRRRHLERSDLNRLCLESLIARTEWPNLEILVVDNASTDGTLELLAQMERRTRASA
jgi:hypothetical protein